MENEGKMQQLKILIDRIEKNLKDVENLDMASLSPLWSDLNAKALAITEDLQIALPLAAEVAPAMIQEISAMKEAVVNMRIDSYNAMSDVTASIVAGKPVHQERADVCEAMLAHSISDPHSQRGIEFCVSGCPYHARCLASEPGEDKIIRG